MYRKVENNTMVLTDEQVIEIITDHTSTVPEIAAKYNITTNKVYALYGGKIYKWITRDPQYKKRTFKQWSKIPREVAEAIKNSDNVDYEAISKQYNITVRYLKHLRYPSYFDSWKTIPVKDFSYKNNYKKPLTKDKIIAILADNKGSGTAVGNRHGVSKTTVLNLRNGVVHKKITRDPRYAYKKVEQDGTGRSNQDGNTEKCYAHCVV